MNSSCTMCCQNSYFTHRIIESKPLVLDGINMHAVPRATRVVPISELEHVEVENIVRQQESDLFAEDFAEEFTDQVADSLSRNNVRNAARQRHGKNPERARSHSRAPTSATSRSTGRVDETTFLEAFQAAQEMATVGTHGNTMASSVTDKVEAVLFAEYEAEDASEHEFENATHDAHPQSSTTHAGLPTPTKAIRERSAFRTLLTCCTIGLNAFWNEICRLVALVPIMIWFTIERKVLSAEHEEWWQVYLWMLLIWMAARLFSVTAISLINFMPFDLPWRVLLFLDAISGSPSTVVLCTFVKVIMPLALEQDTPVLYTLRNLPQFWPVFLWWTISAVCYISIFYLGSLYIAIITSHHYGHRATEAQGAQKLMRKLSLAVKSHKAQQLKSDALLTASTRRRRRRKPKDETQPERLSLNLVNLTGRLQLGVESISSLDQARRRAAKLFEQLVAFEPIVTEMYPAFEKLEQAGEQAIKTDDETTDAAPLESSTGIDQGKLIGIDQDKLLSWLWTVRGKISDEDGVRLHYLFGSQKVVDRGHFIASMERCYKEQRLLNASLQTFDKINTLLLKAVTWIWAVVATFFFLITIGVPFNELLIPVVMLLFSLLYLAGRAPADFISGALYVLLLRPFDIGDRISISDPGRPSALYSLIVKDVGLNRTYFMTVHGELMHIENYLLRNMSMLNLTRSAPPSILIKVQVPNVTPNTKVTELVDSIRYYVAESSEWSGVDILFSKADFEAGHMALDIWATSVHPAHELLKVYGAKSSLLLFIQAYMQTASIEYIKPTIGVKLTAESKTSIFDASPSEVQSQKQSEAKQSD